MGEQVGPARIATVNTGVAVTFALMVTPCTVETDGRHQVLPRGGGWSDTVPVVEDSRMMTMVNSAQQLANRMARAAFADKGLYWELAFDAGAIRQSLLAVVIVAAALGIGSAIHDVMRGSLDDAIGGFTVMGLWGMLYWLLFSVSSWTLARLLAGFFEVDVERVTYLQFVRRFGFVFAPGILLILTPIPFVGEAAVLMAFMWTVLAAAIAIQLTFEVPIGLGVMASSIGMVAALVSSLLIGVYLLP